MSTPAFKPRTVTCPTCRGPSAYALDSAFRPFCSARCKNNDFGAWASESYRVEAKPHPDHAGNGQGADTLLEGERTDQRASQ